MQAETSSKNSISFEDFKTQIIEDYKIAVTSRECSLLGRREVLTGKAKFGIFGDGKEVPQLAWAKAFKDGDFRSGYYRDQTFMMAIGALNIETFFAGLYATSDIEKEPMSAGRQMGGHFSTHSLNEDGTWKNLSKQKNSSADISPTAGQMPRLLGLAQASKIYRNVSGIDAEKFSDNGNEIAWGTIGNASTSEGLFWETINAAGVLQVPMVMNVWDDEYGISVHARHQTTKENISEVLKGFQKDENKNNGYEIFTVPGWDYPALIDIYEKAGKIARESHIPVLIHVVQLTQPQGHSTSGSHERYKDEERLSWEREFDCNLKMRDWILSSNLATEGELHEMEAEIKQQVKEGRRRAWEAHINPIKEKKREILSIMEKVAENSSNSSFFSSIIKEVADNKEPLKRDLLSAARRILRYIVHDSGAAKTELIKWIDSFTKENQEQYSRYLYSESTKKAQFVQAIPPSYDQDAEAVDGRVVLRENFDKIFETRPETLIFGEDTGEIGDVNQGLEGLQSKYGDLRVADTGIREATILGQGIGMAMRGLRPIAEIQYLDYILYSLQIMSDDLATLQYRTAGKQKAPLIIRTRGHRLEGIWHSGSQMGGLLHLLRGIHILVPRNMTKAAGFYNTLLEGDEPGLIIESLNGYRLKEKLPNNLGEFRTPIGVVEVVKEGTDITLVSYGSTLRLVEQAATELLEAGIHAEVIDVQSLLPFDLDHDIVKSLEKTNRLLVIDEDVPGGASAYILHKIIEEQNGWRHLDSKPESLAAKEHRPAYGTDGDYFSKPSLEDIFEKVYQIMHEADPKQFPELKKI